MVEPPEVLSLLRALSAVWKAGACCRSFFVILRTMRSGLEVDEEDPGAAPVDPVVAGPALPVAPLLLAEPEVFELERFTAPEPDVLVSAD